MEPNDTPRTTDAAADAEVQRVAGQIADQLAGRGVPVYDGDSAEDHADLLSAVEAFERARRERGGDSFVNSLQSSDPERPEFVLPRRGDDERAEAYVERVRAAAERLGPSPD